jgi:hypothetical protein
MSPKFQVLLLEEARAFLLGLEDKARVKILYNIDKSVLVNDPKLFKKLTAEIWEFRTRYNGLQYRHLAFWDKTLSQTLVIATHGFVKKDAKVPGSQILRANHLRELYFQQSRKSS